MMRATLDRLSTTIVGLVLLCAAPSRGDELLFAFEGDTLPGTGSDWIVANACELDCSRRIENGRFLLEWGVMGDLVNYGHRIAEPPVAPPPSLWVEWRFRSNQELPTTSASCDARFQADYVGVLDTAYMFQDAVFDFLGINSMLGLDPDVFHTYRFESLDGENYRMSVDGVVFKTAMDSGGNEFHSIQFGGLGSCPGERPIPVRNEWDFIRYGTLAAGEVIEATDPPSGFLDPNTLTDLDRFTITFDAPNYVYVDDVTVETSGEETPVVLHTRRLDNGQADTVEIVLDRPLPPGAHARFIFNDGTTRNVVDYSYILGDADGNGALDLRDVGAFQNCFDSATPLGSCLAFDQDGSQIIDIDDIEPLTTSLIGPRE